VSIEPERNVGQLSDEARPRGNLLALGEGYDGARAPGDVKDRLDCLVRFRLLGGISSARTMACAAA
jgi:hypothetical protein